MKSNNYDIFVNDTIYPKPKGLFGVSIENIHSVKDNSIVVLDTNALLVPYLTGSDSLSEVEKVFKQLIEANRLVIPAQVAREFAKNRPRKLKEIFQQLSRKQSSIQNIQIGNYPLLEGITEYGEASDLESDINEKLKEYRDKIGSLIKNVKSWNWDDPVSKIYRELFREDVIYELSQDKESIEEALQYRYIHEIPPGYKDGSKADEGIGDLLIWLSILDIAKTQKKHLIFVSGEEKSDWFHKSEKQQLYPRFELINEFYDASEGKSLHIVKLSSLLTLFEADEKVVEEIEKEERNTITDKKYRGNSAIIRDQSLVSNDINFEKGTLTIELVEDSFKGHVVGKLHSSFNRPPNKNRVNITSQPQDNPSKVSVIANTGTTHDFHVNLKSFEYNNPLKAGYYIIDFEFEYDESLSNNDD